MAFFRSPDEGRGKKKGLRKCDGVLQTRKSYEIKNDVDYSMEMKHVVTGAIVAILVILVAFFVRGKFSAPASDTIPSRQNSGLSQKPTANGPLGQSSAGTSGTDQSLASPAPIRTDVGSVAGVDLSGFADEANQAMAA